jgi:class 3 adenylate cyclase
MFKVKYKREGHFDILSTSEFQKFNPSILGLGELAKEGTLTHAIAAIFDLEGFTDFCNQIDSHLVVPDFVQDFSHWLFRGLAQELTESTREGEVRLWCRFPFFAKFLGDGILFLWDTSHFEKVDHGSLVSALYEVCNSYVKDYWPRALKMFAKPPRRLRWGIARGQVIAIGNGNDYVGACINVAARLQKLSSLSFAFSRRSFDLETQFG